MELTDLTGNDDVETDVTLSFSFDFAGTGYTSVFVGTNGGIQLGGLGDDDEIDYDLWEDFGEFNDDGGEPVILPFNTDLDLSSTNGTIHFNDFGDRAVFTWNEVGTNEHDDIPGLHLATFQVQLLLGGTIIFGYNGIFDNDGEDLIASLDEGILVGISESLGLPDPGASDLSAGPFSTSATTIYQVWCYGDDPSGDLDDCHDPAGDFNDGFDLDMKNVIFTPLDDGGFLVTNGDGGSADVPEPGTLALLGLGLAGMGFSGRKKKA